MRAAGTCAAAMAVSLLLVACLQTTAPIGQRFMQQYTDAHQQGHIHSIQDLCGKLSGSAQQLCYQYVGAAKEDAWDAAAAWRRTSPESFACSGIEVECLQEDMLSSKVGSACRPLAEGAQCELGKHCSSGYCRGQRTPSTDDSSHKQQQQGGEDEGAAAPRSLLAQMVQPVAAWPTATVSVSSGSSARRVPETFLSTSHEYNRIHDYGDERNVASWAEVFKMLSPSPIIRVGGASQDKMTQVPDDATWKALKLLQQKTNARFILGLPLWPKNATAMGKQIIAASKKYLGNSVIVYELGNEPEFWPTGLGGYDAKGKWKPGIDAYAKWFDVVARQVNPCNHREDPKFLSGPGWGNVNTQPTSWLARVLYTGKDCYLAETNIHYYPYIDNTTVTPKQLLSQSLQDFGLSKYGEYQRLVEKEKLGVRISETNSLYGGGKVNMSDTLIGGLWVADALFAFARAGAKGFHLHWGIGGHPTGDLGQPNTGVQTNFYYKYKNATYEFKQLQALRVDASKLEKPVPWPSVHAPWYGYLFWTIAAAGKYNSKSDATFVNTKVEDKGKCGANMKVWALRADNGDLRIALINKDDAINCNMKLWIDDKRFCRTASISKLLPGQAGIKSKGNITWQGQTYENAGFTGKIQGSTVVMQIESKQYPKVGKCGFEVPVPASSAALLVAKKATK